MAEQSTGSGWGAASLLETSTAILTKISVNENNGCSQSEQLNIKSVCDKDGKIWRPQLGRTRKLAEDRLHLELENLEVLSSSMSYSEDVDKLENEDETDFENESDDDLSDSLFLPLEPSQSSQICELLTEKEDWEKELNEAHPYDASSIETSRRREKR